MRLCRIYGFLLRLVVLCDPHIVPFLLEPAVLAFEDVSYLLGLRFYLYAPIILDDVNDIRSVYLYHDCSLKVQDHDETKRAWVKSNRKFSDTIPMDGQQGYEEVTFVRLQQGSYTIPSF